MDKIYTNGVTAALDLTVAPLIKGQMGAYKVAKHSVNLIRQSPFVKEGISAAIKHRSLLQRGVTVAALLLLAYGIKKGIDCSGYFARAQTSNITKLTTKSNAGTSTIGSTTPLISQAVQTGLMLQAEQTASKPISTAVQAMLSEQKPKTASIAIETQTMPQQNASTQSISVETQGIAVQTSTVESNETGIQSLSAQVESTGIQTEDDAHLQKLQLELKTLQALLHDATKAYHAVSSKADTAECDNKVLQDENQSLTKTVKVLEDKLARLEADNKAFKQEQKSVEPLLNEAQQNLHHVSQLQEELVDSKEMIDAQQDQITQLSQQSAGLMAMMQEMNQLIQDSSDESLKQSIQELLTAAVTEKDALTRENDSGVDTDYSSSGEEVFES